jgi:hypothetical protein
MEFPRCLSCARESGWERRHCGGDRGAAEGLREGCAWSGCARAKGYGQREKLMAAERRRNIASHEAEIRLHPRARGWLKQNCGTDASAPGKSNSQTAKGSNSMKITLSLAAMALAALLLATPTSTQASALKLDGLHQDSLVQTAAAAKKKKKKVMKKKKKKKYAKKAKKKKPMKKKRVMKKKPG